MPLYEYRCEQCGQKFETIQKFSDAPLTTHQGCGGAVEKLISSPSFHFKGSGWYVTDYAKGGNSPKPDGEKSEKSDKADKSDKSEKSDKSGSTAAETKAETKPVATATDTK